MVLSNKTQNSDLDNCPSVQRGWEDMAHSEMKQLINLKHWSFSRHVQIAQEKKKAATVKWSSELILLLLQHARKCITCHWRDTKPVTLGGWLKESSQFYILEINSVLEGKLCNTCHLVPFAFFLWKGREEEEAASSCIDQDIVGQNQLGVRAAQTATQQVPFSPCCISAEQGISISLSINLSYLLFISGSLL